MRNKIYIVTLLCSVLSLSSCDVMNTKPFDKLDGDQAFGSVETFEAVLNQSYADVLGYYSGQYASMEAYTPMGINSNLHSRNNFPCEVGIDATSWDGGQGRFGAFCRLNSVIANAESTNVLTEDSKKVIISSAKFLRSLMYFDMTRKMGRFIPVNELLELKDTLKMKALLTSSPEESYKLIFEDLNASIDNLPERALSGKITRGAALAFKSRIALQAYAYTSDSKYLDESIAAADKVISSGNYQLTSNFDKMFLYEGKDDPEIILNRQYLKLNTTVGSFNEMISAIPNVNNDEVSGSGGSPLLINPKGRSFEGWANYFPTQELIDQYLVIDETSGKAVPLYESSQYLNNIDELSVSSLTYNAFTKNPDYDGTPATTEYVGFHPVPERDDLGINEKGNKIHRYAKVKEGSDQNVSDIFYSKRDQRFYSTIVYDNSTWLSGEKVTLNVRGNIWAGVRKEKSSSWYTTVSGYYWRKAVDNVDPRVYYNNKIDYQFVLIRLGEMYMNIAEAKLLKGDVEGAVAALNVTRTKHGGLPPSTASSLSEAWKDYIRERTCEMVYEGDLYWSYLRWGKYGGDANHGEAPGAVIKDLNKPVSRIQISADRKSFFIGQIIVNNAWDRNFNTKRYLWPIPQSFLNGRAAYGIIDKQNPGWD